MGEPELGSTLEAAVARVPAGEARLWVVLTLDAPDLAAEAARPKLATMLALDVSGSMRGAPLEQVVASVDRIVGLLGDDDELGVVVFSSNAGHVAELAPLDAAHRRPISRRAPPRRRPDERRRSGATCSSSTSQRRSTSSARSCRATSSSTFGRVAASSASFRSPCSTSCRGVCCASPA